MIKLLRVELFEIAVIGFMGIWSSRYRRDTKRSASLTMTQAGTVDPQLDNRFGKRTADRVTLNGSDLALRRYHIPYPQDKNR